MNVSESYDDTLRPRASECSSNPDAFRELSFAASKQLLSGVSLRVTEYMQSFRPSCALEILNEALRRSAEFETKFKESEHFELSASQEKRLDQWFVSRTGWQVIAALMDVTLDTLWSYPVKGFPSHDKRHILLHDPLAALQFTLEDGLSGYKRTFLLSTLCHDVSRLVEPQIEETPLNGPFNDHHAKLSFLIAERLFSFYRGELDEVLRDHLLYAILKHSSHEDTPHFLLHAVQRADREQLVGPEGILRIVGGDTSVFRAALHLPPDDTHRTSLPPLGLMDRHHVLHTIEFYVRNLHASIGTKARQKEESLRAISGSFLFLSVPALVREQVFAPELLRSFGENLGTERFKKILPEPLWQKIAAGPSADVRDKMRQLTESHSAEELLYRFLTPALATKPNEDALPEDWGEKPSNTLNFWDDLRTKLQVLNSEERACFSEGIAFAKVMQSINDEEMGKIPNLIFKAFPDTEEIEHKLAKSIVL